MASRLPQHLKARTALIIIKTVQNQNRQQSNQSLLQQFQSLLDCDSFLPVLPDHLVDSLPNGRRAVRVKLKLDIFGTGISLELTLAREWQFLMNEQPHSNAHRPHIRSFAGIALLPCKLMLGPSKPRSPGCKVRHIILSLIPDRSKINNNNLISHLLSLPPQYVINLNVPISDIILMQILHTMAQLNEHDLNDGVEFFCFVF